MDGRYGVEPIHATVYRRKILLFIAVHILSKKLQCSVHKLKTVAVHYIVIIIYRVGTTARPRHI
jgi:hypothetical protein